MKLFTITLLFTLLFSNGIFAAVKGQESKPTIIKQGDGHFKSFKVSVEIKDNEQNKDEVVVTFKKAADEYSLGLLIKEKGWSELKKLKTEGKIAVYKFKVNKKNLADSKLTLNTRESCGGAGYRLYLKDFYTANKKS